MYLILFLLSFLVTLNISRALKKKSIWWLFKYILGLVQTGVVVTGVSWWVWFRCRANRYFTLKKSGFYFKNHFVSQKKIMKLMCENTITESTNIFFHLLIIPGFIMISLYDFFILVFCICVLYPLHWGVFNLKVTADLIVHSQLHLLQQWIFRLCNHLPMSSQSSGMQSDGKHTHILKLQEDCK